MRKRGDRSIPITEKDIAIVEKFLTNDLTYEQMAKQEGITKPHMIRIVHKYQAMQNSKGDGDNGEKNSKRGDTEPYPQTPFTGL